MPAALRLAEEVGSRLGRCPLLQRRLPSREGLPQPMTSLLVVHLAVTWALVGLIWANEAFDPEGLVTNGGVS